MKVYVWRHQSANTCPHCQSLFLKNWSEKAQLRKTYFWKPWQASLPPTLPHFAFWICETQTHLHIVTNMFYHQKKLVLSESWEFQWPLAVLLLVRFARIRLFSLLLIKTKNCYGQMQAPTNWWSFRCLDDWILIRSNIEHVMGTFSMPLKSTGWRRNIWSLSTMFRCNGGPTACIMVWPDGYQGVSKYDYM